MDMRWVPMPSFGKSLHPSAGCTSGGRVLFPDIDVTSKEGSAVRRIETAVDHRQDATGDRVEENARVERTRTPCAVGRCEGRMSAL